MICLQDEAGCAGPELQDGLCKVFEELLSIGADPSAWLAGWHF